MFVGTISRHDYEKYNSNDRSMINYINIYGSLMIKQHKICDIYNIE